MVGSLSQHRHRAALEIKKARDADLVIQREPHQPAVEAAETRETWISSNTRENKDIAARYRRLIQAKCENLYGQFPVAYVESEAMRE